MIKKILCIILILAMSISFLGCKQKVESTENKESTEEIIDTTGIANSKFKFIDGGESEYKIVIPKEYSNNEKLAADEIILFVDEATGVELKLVTDDKVTYTENAKLILLGDTAYTQMSGLDLSVIPEQGFSIKTVGQNVFILGEDLGVLYGAYDFLHYEIGFEPYAYDCVYVETGLKDVYLKDFDYTDSPDILYRGINWQVQMNVDGYPRRARLVGFGGVFMTYSGGTQHNTFTEYFPKGTYADTHKEWYAGSGEYDPQNSPQLCFTAHGNDESLAEMRTIALEKMKFIVSYYFDQGQYLPAINFSTEDNSRWCNCDACSVLKSKYGTDSASIIIFLNPIARELQSWIGENYPGKEVVITFFAYHATEAAPVKEENGKFVPIDDAVKMEDNLAAYYAAIYHPYIYSIDHDLSKGFVAVLEQWRAVSKKLYVWSYDTNFSHYLAYYDTSNSIQGLYQLLKEQNVEYLFHQGQYGAAPNVTGFDLLKAYLESKLAWDVNADLPTLTTNYFNAYFGEGAEAMLNYYNSFRSWEEYLRTKGKNGNIYAPIVKEEYPKAVLDGWYKCIEEAYASIEYLKKIDIGKYEMYYDRICAESIAVRFYLLQYYSSSYTETELKAKREAFKYDADRLGFTNYGETTGSLESALYVPWGIA